MKSKLILLLILGLSASSIQASSLRIFTISADEWARPRSGAVIAEFEAARAAVNYWEQAFDHSILIRYPGEDSGELWASELRDWLVSLGVPMDYIDLVSGSQSAGEIRLIVGKRSDFDQ
ncbi:MAG: hypothetical protein HKN34_03460 [Gammaproteobacteria bacterium]|nr:hypothetical protein [Gammaproteobacteria bacterium]